MTFDLNSMEICLPNTKEKTDRVLGLMKKVKKIEKVAKILKSNRLTIPAKIEICSSNVLEVLSKFKDRTLIIRDKITFVNYIDKIIENGICGIDTETNNSLDPLTCKLMGLCLYTEGMKQAYVPVNHIDYYTGKLLDNQLTEDFIGEQLARLHANNVFNVLHNAKFDYEVLYCTCGVRIDIGWDTEIGANVLEENGKHGLKYLYTTLLDDELQEYSIEALYSNIPYAYFDPFIFGLYSAADPYETIELFKWQLAQFRKPENSKIFDLFKNVEMPLVEICAKMELRGITLDTEYASRLEPKFQKIVNGIKSQVDEELLKLKDVIDDWKSKHKKDKDLKLEDPINIDSPTQLAILLYDILNCPVVDPDKPRGTGKEIIETLAEETDYKIIEVIKDWKVYNKVYKDFIIALPQKVGIDGRIHGSFNQYGAKTGRFSSSSPNLQQIPSKNKEVRLLFRAKEENHTIDLIDNTYKITRCDEVKLQDGSWVDVSKLTTDTVLSNGAVVESSVLDNDIYTIYLKSHGDVVQLETKTPYTLVGSDFSQQEPRLLSYMSNDKDMINAYVHGKDLYAMIASKVFHNNYEDNLEHFPDGSKNPDGAKRRSSCKGLLLGIMYGMGTKSISKRIGCSEEEAKSIVDGFYNEFKSVKEWIDKSQKFAHLYGYVEDFYGRRRRLRGIQLDKYSASFNVSDEGDWFNPLPECLNRNEDTKKLDKYVEEAKATTNYKELKAVKERALKDGITIKSNTATIARTERQCVNARIQGSAATMTKIAMIKLDRSEELRNLGFSLLIGVHDELIGECPLVNVDRVAELLTTIMKTCISDFTTVPFKCDAAICRNWYQDELESYVLKAYNEYIKQGMSKEDAYLQLLVAHSELLPEQISQIIN